MCVVDARHLVQHLEDSKHPGKDTVNEAVQQIAFSDVILLNKIDLVTEEEKNLVLQAVKKINFTARIVECQMNDPARRPSIDKLLGINSFSIDRTLEVSYLAFLAHPPASNKPGSCFPAGSKLSRVFIR